MKTKTFLMFFLAMVFIPPLLNAETKNAETKVPFKVPFIFIEDQGFPRAYQFNDNFQALADEIDNLKKQLEEVSVPQLPSGVEGLPVGFIIPYAGSDFEHLEKLGWLPCNGGVVNKGNYPKLYNVISTTFGQAEGIGSFRLPDLSGRVPMGAGPGNDDTVRILGDALGKETHTLTEAELPPHMHEGTTKGGNPVSHTRMVSVAGKNLDAYHQVGYHNEGAFYKDELNTTKYANSRHTHDFETKKKGSGEAHNIIQPSLVLNFIIKAK